MCSATRLVPVDWQVFPSWLSLPQIIRVQSDFVLLTRDSQFFIWKPNFNIKFCPCWKFLRIFAKPQASPDRVGRRYHVLGKTFSDVCLVSYELRKFTNPQQADSNEDVRVVRICYALPLVYSIWYWLYCISYWRGLDALLILCGKGNAKACDSRMGRNRHLRLFYFMGR